MTTYRTRLSRSRNGFTIHRSDCRFATTARPWDWAEKRPDDVVRRWADAIGLNLCGHCKPLNEKGV